MAEERAIAAARGVRRQANRPCCQEEYNGLSVAMRSAPLISTYELGRQPFGLASAAAWLRAAGGTSTCVDVAKEQLGDGRARVGRSRRVSPADAHGDAPGGAGHRQRAAAEPAARICAFGLYAPLNAEWLRSLGVDEVFGGEFEEELTAWR